MADPHRRYARRDDEINARGRSPSAWRSQSPRQRGSLSPIRHRRPPPRNAGRYSARSQSSPHSPPRFRNRSPSPPPRGNRSPRRARSRSPPSNYSIENPESRRRRLLSEKVMSLEMFHRLLLDSKSPWARKSGTTPIPVPLTSKENTGDYQQKFEFWLAQRNVTLASFRDDVMLERSYRFQYAHWRVQKHYGQPPPVNGKTPCVHGRQRSRSRSPPWSRKRDELDRKRYRPRSSETTLDHQGESQSSRISSLSNSTPEPSRFYDVRHRVTLSRRCDDGNNQESDTCSKNCERKWADLSRRLEQLECIVSRLDWPRMSALNTTSASPYEANGEFQPSRDDSSPTCIDLTDDIEVEPDTDLDPIQTEAKEDAASPDGNNETQSRSVEITPTDSDSNNGGVIAVGRMEELITDPMGDFELKSQPELMALITVYDQLNDQVAVKQSEEQKVVADMESMVDEDETVYVELKYHLRGLRDSIKKEKDERDAAIAAIIVHARADNRKELEQELGKEARLGLSSDQDDLHEKCAGIAGKLAEKENVLARLQKQLQSLSSFPMRAEESDQALGEREVQELSSKIGLERASKTSLETERQKIFTRLMKSSLHIQVLVTKKLRSELTD